MLKKIIRTAAGAAAACATVLGALLPAAAADTDSAIIERTKEFAVMGYAYNGKDNPYQKIHQVPVQIQSLTGEREGDYVHLLGYVPKGSRIGNVNAHLFRAMPEDGKEALVTYCLDAGKTPPSYDNESQSYTSEPTRMEYDAKPLDDLLYAVIRSGYPYKTDYTIEKDGQLQQAEDWQLEWATSMALYMASPALYNAQGMQLYAGIASYTDTYPEETGRQPEKGTAGYIFTKEDDRYYLLEQKEGSQEIQKTDITQIAAKAKAHEQETAIIENGSEKTEVMRQYTGWSEMNGAMLAYAPDIYRGTLKNERIVYAGITEEEKKTSWSTAQIALEILERAKEMESVKQESVTTAITDKDGNTLDSLKTALAKEDGFYIKAELDADWESLPQDYLKQYPAKEEAGLVSRLYLKERDGSWKQIGHDIASLNGQMVHVSLSDSVFASQQLGESLEVRVESYAVGLNLPTRSVYYAVSEDDTTHAGVSDRQSIQKMYVTETVTLHGSAQLKIDQTLYARLQKVDGTSGSALEGAVFKAENTDTKESRILTTDRQGYLYIPVSEMKAGHYTLQETRPAAGYVLDEAVLEFDVSQQGKIEGLQSAVIKNEQTEVVIEKVDAETKSPLAGAVFEIRNEAGDLAAASQNRQSDDRGRVSLKGLLPGTYTVKENTAPDGYALSEQTLEFVLDENGNLHSEYPLVFENEKIQQEIPDIVIKKTDSQSKEGLAGAQFRIEDEQGKSVLEDLVSGEGGVVRFAADSLAPGRYSLIETRAPKGYILPSAGNVLTFELLEDYRIKDAEDNILRVENTSRDLVLIKTDAQSEKPLAGAAFALEKGDDVQSAAESVAAGVTDADGRICFKAIEPGHYLLRETAAPYGYRQNSAPVSVSVDEDGTLHGSCVKDNTVSAANQPEKAVITKTDTFSGQPVPGAQLEVFSETGESQTFTTDLNGEISLYIRDLVPGTYTVREAKAPQGYRLNREEICFTIEKDGSVGEKSVLNFENAPVEVSVVKTDSESSQPLAGAVFTVYSEGGNEAGTLTTGEDGKASLLYLPAGRYVLTETKAPEGYQRSEAEYAFEIRENMEEIVEFTVQNSRIEEPENEEPAKPDVTDDAQQSEEENLQPADETGNESDARQEPVQAVDAGGIAGRSLTAVILAVLAAAGGLLLFEEKTRRKNR